MLFLKNSLFIALTIFEFVVLPGCATKETALTSSEADRKFIEIVREEFHYNPVVNTAGKTVWIYLPREREIFQFKASQGQQTPRKFLLEYIDVYFEDNSFVLEYDIVPAAGKKSSKNNGITSSYSEAFGEENRNLMSAIMRAYFDVKDINFIVSISADIKSGIEVISTLYIEDFKKYQASLLPPEEYFLRALTDSKGSEKIINDTAGNHLAREDIFWEDFIARQIAQRINFKYQQSDFEPGEDTQKELLRIVQQTVHIYNFSDFTSVRLYDLRSGVSQAYGRNQLQSLSPP